MKVRRAKGAEVSVRPREGGGRINGQWTAALMAMGMDASGVATVLGVPVAVAEKWCSKQDVRLYAKSLEEHGNAMARGLLQKAAPMAAITLVQNLAAKGARDRTEAAKALLDRAGVGPTQRVEAVVATMTDEQVLEELRRMRDADAGGVGGVGAEGGDGGGRGFYPGLVAEVDAADGETREGGAVPLEGDGEDGLRAGGGEGVGGEFEGG